MSKSPVKAVIWGLGQAGWKTRVLYWLQNARFATFYAGVSRVTEKASAVKRHLFADHQHLFAPKHKY